MISLNYFTENITEVKSTDFKVSKTDFPYFSSLAYGKNLRQVNDGKHHPTLQAEGFSSFQVIPNYFGAIED